MLPFFWDDQKQSFTGGSGSGSLEEMKQCGCEILVVVLEFGFVSGLHR